MHRPRTRPAPSGGSVYHRPSRHTGKPSPTWWIAYYVDGKKRRESTHTTDLEVAQRLLRARLHALDEGTYVGPERERLTVDAVLDALLDSYVAKGRASADTAPSQVKAWRAPLGTCRALDVTTGRVLRLITTWQADGTTNATINRRLALLRRAYHLAKLRLDPARLDFSECMLDEASPRRRHLSPAIFAAIAAQLDVGRRQLFEFCYITGKRRGQMSRTTWAHYDATQEEFAWTAAEVKAKHAEVLPLAGRALSIIAELHAVRRLHCRYVFHGPDCGHRPPSQRYGCVGDFKRLWKTACVVAGVPAGRKRGGFVFHNTRHTAITNLVNEGTPAHEAMAISGHRTRHVFDRYSISLKGQMRAALERVSGHTLGHTPGENPAKIRGHRRAKRAKS